MNSNITRILILNFLLLVPKLLFSQFAGQYSVGNSGSYFSNIDTALQLISTQGMSADVELLLVDGSYSSLVINGFTNPNQYKLTIRSASGNSQACFFKNCRISNSSDLLIKEIGFYKVLANNWPTVWLDLVDNVTLSNCKIIDTVTTSFGHSSGVLRIDHTQSSNSTNCHIDSCYILGLNGIAPYLFSGEYTVFFGLANSNGRTVFSNDTIIGNWGGFGGGVYRVDSSYLKFYEGLDIPGMEESTYSTFDLYNSPFSNYNTIRGDLRYVTVFGNQYVDFYSKHIDSCNFYANSTIEYKSGGYVQNSNFYEEFYCRGMFNKRIENNNFYSDANFGGANSSLINKNIFYAKAHGNLPKNGTVISNNFFCDSTNITTTGGGFKVLFNNFGDSSYLFFAGSGSLLNNNINKLNAFFVQDSINSNNYKSRDIKTLNIAAYDNNAKFYDPEYSSIDDLHISNDALSGSTLKISEVNFDFDDQIRPNNTNIGADHTCLGIPLPDTIFIHCGDLFAPDLCPEFDSLHYLFESDSFQTQIHNSFSAFEITSNGLLFVKDSFGNYIDSTLILLKESDFYKRKIINANCGYPTQLFTQTGSLGSVYWTPGHLMDDSTLSIVNVLPDTSMSFIAHIDLGVCGTHNDTIDLILDEKPNPSGDITRLSCSNFLFRINHQCYDSIIWYFSSVESRSGDSVIYSYNTLGSYSVKMTVWKNNQDSSSFLVFNVYCTDLMDKFKNDIKIYPNPVRDILKLEISEKIKEPLEISILNLEGKLILKKEIFKEITQLNISKLKPGIYFYQIRYDSRISRGKIMKL